MRKLKRQQRKKKKQAVRPDTVNGLLQQGMAHHQAGRLRDAEKLYRQALAPDPDQPDANHLLGVIAIQEGRHKAAVELILRAVKKNPTQPAYYCNLGTALQKSGKLDQAVEAFQEAITIKPDFAEAFCNLGNALQESNRLDKAITAYDRAIEIKPDYAEALNNLGNIYMKQGNLDQAGRFLKKALAVRPDYAEAHNNLGFVLNELEMFDDALAAFNAALHSRPDFAEAHYNIGNACRELGKPEKAAESYRNAIARNPGFADAHQNLGNILKELGEADEAMKAYRTALQIKPDFTSVYRQLTSIKRFDEYSDDVRRMEKLYNQPSLESEQRMHICFALGKAFEDLRKFDVSFQYLQEGNRLKRETYHYTLSEEKNAINKLQKVFDARLFDRLSPSGFPDKTPLFILGMPRSGTTLVEQILASHPVVFGAGELKHLAEVIKKIYAESGTLDLNCFADSTPDEFLELGREYASLLRQHSETARHITDKMPQNFLSIGIIKLILPEAKIIHCRRNPMDTCFSIYKNYFTEEHNYAYDLVELGEYYKLYSGLMEHWHRVLPGFIYDILYEELIADQETQTRRLLAYCDLEWDDACMSFHKAKRQVKTASNAQVREPIYSSSVQRWECYKKDLQPLVEVLDRTNKS